MVLPLFEVTLPPLECEKKFLKKIFLSIFLWDFKSRIFFRVNKCLYGNWAFAFTSLMADLHSETPSGKKKKSQFMSLLK